MKKAHYHYDEHDPRSPDYEPDPRLLRGWHSLAIDFWLGIMLGGVLVQLFS